MSRHDHIIDGETVVWPHKMPTLTYILDAEGCPVPEPDALAWSAWRQAHDADRPLGRTVLPEGVLISTVFLGIDHGYGRPGALPVLWETMIFGFREGHSLHDWRDRYDTPGAARKGHDYAVALAERAVRGEPLPEDEDE